MVKDVQKANFDLGQKIAPIANELQTFNAIAHETAPLTSMMDKLVQEQTKVQVQVDNIQSIRKIYDANKVHIDTMNNELKNVMASNSDMTKYNCKNKPGYPEDEGGDGLIGR